MSGPVLAVSDLTTEFFTKAGTVRAVNGVSFVLNRGEILGLVGESGSGKSVTGFSLLGLIEAPGRITGGKVLLGGEDLVGMKPAAIRSLRGRRIAMVFQDPMMTLNPVLSIVTQMGLAITAHEKASKEEIRRRAAAALTKVGIPDAARRLDDFPHQFSGGMRQRVAIATALLHQPEVIIADEPTTALDVSIQAQILAEVRKLVAETGTAFIWISHDLATIAALSDRIAVMYAGRIVEEGPTEAVLTAPRHPYTAGLLASLPAQGAPGEALKQIPGGMPALGNLPPGCAFAPRCERAAEICKTPPEMTRAGTRGHRCWRPIGLEGVAA